LPTDAAEQLHTLLKAESERARLRAAEILTLRFGDNMGRDALIELLQASDPKVATDAGDYLVEFEPTGEVLEKVRRAAGSNEPFCRIAASYVLRSFEEMTADDAVKLRRS
jgi:hypothetical protein